MKRFVTQRPTHCLPLRRAVHRSTAFRRGSALIALFWIMSLLGFAVVASLSVVKIQSDVVTQESHGRLALQLAERGIAVAAHGKIKVSDPLLNYTAEGGEEGYRASYRSLATTFGLNDLIRKAGEGRKTGVPLENSFLGLLFIDEWGMELQQAEFFLSCLIEWVDTNEVINTLTGWESRNYEAEGYYGYPYNRHFYSLDEVEFVEGYEFLETAQPDWRRYFNVWTDSQIDFTEASAEMISLASLTQGGRVLSRLDAEEILREVLGEDGRRGTEDDLLNPTAEAVFSPVLSANNQYLIAQRYTGKSPYTQLESTGWSGKVYLTIKMSLQGRGSSPQLLERVESTTYQDDE